LVHDGSKRYNNFCLSGVDFQPQPVPEVQIKEEEHLAKKRRATKRSTVEPESVEEGNSPAKKRVRKPKTPKATAPPTDIAGCVDVLIFLWFFVV
jgi:hypothetical protein